MTIKSASELNKDRMVIDLTGPQGNAFFLLGTARKLANRCDIDADTVIEEMKSGDYDNLVDVFDKYFGDFVDLYR